MNKLPFFSPQINGNITFVLFALALILSLRGEAQTVQYSVFGVFSQATDNDSLLVAGGQIMAGESEEPYVEHGYYPLNHSLLSVDESPSLFSYTIYPNPSRGEFTLALRGGLDGETRIEVYAMNGRLISSQKTTDKNIVIAIKPYASGIYYVRGYTSDKRLFNQKIIKL